MPQTLWAVALVSQWKVDLGFTEVVEGSVCGGDLLLLGVLPASGFKCILQRCPCGISPMGLLSLYHSP